VVLGLGQPAQAHGQFVTSTPASGSIVTTQLDTIYLYFTEKPTSDAFFSVTSPNKTRVDKLWSHGPTQPINPPVHEWYHNPDGTWVPKSYNTAYSAQIPIAYWPEAGVYKVDYLSVATDGEPVRGELTFTYSGPVTPMPVDFRPQSNQPDPILNSIAATDAPTAPPTGPPIEDVVAAQNAGPGLWVLWVPLGLALAAALAILVFWRLRPHQARELMVSRFGGRYTAPAPRRPIALPPGLTARLPTRLPPAKRTEAGAVAVDEPDRPAVPPPGPSAE
jgi:methionine-rich copper-binding protein CopC